MIKDLIKSIEGHDCGKVEWIISDRPRHEVHGQVFPVFGWECLGCGKIARCGLSTMTAYDASLLSREYRKLIIEPEGRQAMAEQWNKDKNHD